MNKATFNLMNLTSFYKSINGKCFKTYINIILTKNIISFFI